MVSESYGGGVADGVHDILIQCRENCLFFVYYYHHCHCQCVCIAFQLLVVICLLVSNIFGLG